MGRGRPPNGIEWLTIQLCKAFEANVLSEPEQAWAAAPLPPAFGSPAELYSTMKSLVLDEAFAMVREGLTSRKRAVTLRMRIDATLRASDRGARLGALSVTAVGASAPDISSALRSGSVFCLSRGDYQVLAVVDGRSQDGFGKCLLEVSDAALVRLTSAGALSDASLWTARCVASVLTQQRCADACLRQPKVAFMRNLLGARPRCHIRFDGEGQADAGDVAGGASSEGQADVAGGASSEGADDSADAVGAAAAYSTGLNACQRKVVDALGASQNGAVIPDLVLLQGPPGTGKTTALVQVLRAIMARPECARVLVCAPSNRGVQEVLERFLATVAAAGSGDQDTGNGDGGGDETAAESCGEGTGAAQGSSSSSKGGGKGPAAGTGEESWRWCCRAGRWIPPGGDGEGGGTASICEEDVALVGDADKVPHGSSSARVFVHWIEDHWAAELTRATESLRHLASRLDGEVEDGEIEDEIEDTWLGLDAASDGRPFAFCTRADRACKIRISHTECCAASGDALLGLLTDASNVVASVRKGLQRRMPYTLKQSGAALEKGLAESTRSLALALTELKGGRGRWPCTLAGRALHLAGAIGGAANALSAASLGLVELREASRQEDRASEMLGSARLVFCTLTVSGCYLVRCMPPVDILVVDEAAQATEPEALIPLGLEPRVMLVCGDPYQLSCTCISRRAKAAGLERSLMQRIMDAGSASRFFFLEDQYRMHPAISAFPSRRFYSGRLKDASVCATRPGLFGDGAVSGDGAWLGRPWTFLDVSGNGEERDHGGSVCNRDEAAAVVATVCALRGRGIDIGRTRSLRVLTFYSAQVRCVTRALEAAGVREGVMVGTVDGAQGAESDVVILSFVRSNNNASIGFVEDWRRLNVAITRAKHALIMIGSARTLGSGEAGEAASDLIRAAASASAIWSYTEHRTAEMAPQLCAELLAAPGPGSGGAAKRRRAAPEAAATATTPTAGEHVSGQSKPMRPRSCVRAEVQPRQVDASADQDADGAYLALRSAEIEAYVGACKRADAAKAAKRQGEVRAARAPFAPPVFTCDAADGECEVFG